MLDAAFWGLVQGLTEFLPVSSSGHLVLVPALLDREQPDLAITAILHLGTLAAVLVYYRADIARMIGFRRDPEGRRILWLVLVGTIPAVVAGLLLESQIDDLFDDPVRVAWALLITGAVLLGSRFIPRRKRELGEGDTMDAATVGIAQAAALVPGISRSGMTIVAGLGRGLDATQAARYSFLLGIPAIAGGGLLEMAELADAGGLRAEVFVGAGVAAVVGYASIAVLLRLLGRAGLTPFGVYCVLAGTASLFLL